MSTVMYAYSCSILHLYPTGMSFHDSQSQAPAERQTRRRKKKHFLDSAPLQSSSLLFLSHLNLYEGSAETRRVKACLSASAHIQLVKHTNARGEFEI